MQKYFIIAGEPSGDLHGSHLMKEMTSMNPNISFKGIGGPLMSKCGLSSIASINDMAVMGFWEVIKKFPFLKSVEKKVLNMVDESFVSIILIDYPGFNLHIAKKIKKRFPNINIVFYISPQIWAWKEKRIETIKKYVDKMIVIFDFEKTWYKERSVDALFVGHPFVDYYAKKDLKKDAFTKLGLDRKKKYLTLFPGSRAQEIRNHLPVMLQALKNDFFKDFEVLIGQAHGLDFDLEKRFNLEKVMVVKDFPELTLAAADFAWVGSGTSSLESVIFNTPFVLVYKTSPLSWYFMKKYVKVNYAGMPNIILDRPLVPELLQENLTSVNLIYETKEILSNKNKQQSLLDGYEAIKQKLGPTGVSRRVANYILHGKD